jgi:hypothetical protein
MVSTFQPAAMPAAFNTMRIHWLDVGACDEMEDGFTVSLIVEPPHIMISGV